MSEAQEPETKEAPPVAASDASTNGSDTHSVAAPSVSVNPRLAAAARVNTKARRKAPGRERASYMPALRYRFAGLAVTPTKGKKPLLPEWQKARSLHDEWKAGFPDDTIPGLLGPHGEMFQPGINVGVLNGEPSGGLLDVDLDASEAVKLAPMFLPATACIFGRASKRRS